MKNSELSANSTALMYLQNKGDKISGRVTESGRKVVKMEKDNGRCKYSATQYTNGTTVETKTTKM